MLRGVSASQADVSRADFALACPACERPWPFPARDDGTRAPAGTAPVADAPACPSCGHAARWEDGVLVLDDLPGAGDYPAGAYDAVARVEDRHWWYRSRNDVIARALAGLTPGCAVEIGCGTGFVLAALERLGWRVLGLDMRIEGLRHARRRTDAPLVRTGAACVPLAAPVDLVVLCDVLEHTDEVPLVQAAVAALRPGGHVLVTVPARPSLWSSEDVFVGHRRRYTSETLLAALQHAGLHVVVLRPFHACVTPLAARAVKKERAAAAPPSRDAWLAATAVPPRTSRTLLMRAALALENRLGARVPLPFGSALLALARRETGM